MTQWKDTPASQGFLTAAIADAKVAATHAGHVTASLANVAEWTDAAVATAQKIRSATSAAEAGPLVTELIAQTNNISNGVDANKDGTIGWQAGEGGLAQANQHMMLMMKGEGL